MTPTTRAAKIAQYKRGSVWHPDHLHTDYFEYYLRDFVKDGDCLNVCCGYSEVGQIRIDNSKDSARTADGDLFQMLWPDGPFKESSVDYVYCDPPFHFYSSGTNRFRWQFDLFKIAKRALITRRPRIGINMPSKRHEYLVLEDSRPTLTLVRIDYK